MSTSELELDLDELSSAEDFLAYFDVAYEAAVVHVNRLHILQRFHDYLAAAAPLPDDDGARFAVYRAQLQRAYLDFVHSSAQAEKVFRVFRLNEPQQAFVALDDLLGQVTNAPAV